MTCPSHERWHLLSLDLLGEEEAAQLHAHAEECAACRVLLGAARQDHSRLLRAFEVFDRNHDQLREQLLAALPPEPVREQADGRGGGWRRVGGVMMSIHSKVGARAAAAVLAVAACLTVAVVLLFPGEGQSAFAAAIEHLQQAKTIVCRVSSTSPVAFGGMQIEVTGKLYISDEFGTRYESYANGIPVCVNYTPPEGPITVVNPVACNYMVIDTREAGGDVREGNSPDEFIRLLRNLSAQADRDLGEKTIDGVEAVGYEISGQTLGLGAVPEARSELWVDVQTRLPVAYVAELPGFQPGTTWTLAFDRFEWDMPLDPQLFEPEIPAGYTRLDARMPAPTEATLIDALGTFAELADKYPEKTDMSSLVGELASAIAAKAVRTGNVDQQALAQQSIEIGAGFTFFQRLVKDGREPEYFGATVQPGDAEAVLLRWKLDDEHWRVVYGDLRAETISIE